jgi:predicted nicotinamide N-methyase
LKSSSSQPPDSTQSANVAGFIEANLDIAAAPSVPEIRLYTAHPASGLRRLLEDGTADEEATPPYWAYRWAGGTVLARYILDRPETVVGKRILDLGTGCGIVGIAAMKAGALSVIAADVDCHAVVAAGLNAALNGVAIETVLGDLTEGPVPDVDVVAIGDLFYEEALAVRVIAFLDRCRSAGVSILIGDPGRTPLPRARLRLLAEYPVSDFAETGTIGQRPSAVFTLREKQRSDGTSAAG